ncbi:conserved protein of unknown function [Pseudomonas marincola]|uniref:Uncharacterized protein n=1 Tax=Pseudomonas marincola TaxID=437900 RepID=A0A653E663_9PSED|nr:conserved protein of unknown function [Pseudomonas marincola]
MRGAFKVADLLPVIGYIFRAETFTRIKACAQAALPTNFADPAATHFEQTRGIGAGIAGQIHHQRADQLWLELFEHLRRDQAFGHARATRWRDRVDHDVVLAPFNGERAGQAVQTELGHAVVGLAEVAVNARSRCSEDYPAIALLAHIRPGGAGYFISTLDMDLVDKIPVGVFHLVKGLVAQDTGIVDHHINASKLSNGVGDNLVTVGHRVMVGNRSTARRADFLDNLVRRRCIGAFAMRAAAQVVNHNLGAMFGEQQCVCPTQAAAGACNDDYLILKTNRCAHDNTPGQFRQCDEFHSAGGNSQQSRPPLNSAR